MVAENDLYLVLNNSADEEYLCDASDGPPCARNPDLRRQDFKERAEYPPTTILTESAGLGDQGKEGDLRRSLHDRKTCMPRERPAQH
jgi:hypothetical protein